MHNFFPFKFCKIFLPMLNVCIWTVSILFLTKASFFGHLLVIRKKSSPTGHNVWKYRLVSTVMASFNTTMKQMIEISQWPNVSAKKTKSEDDIELYQWYSHLFLMDP